MRVLVRSINVATTVLLACTALSALGQGPKLLEDDIEPGQQLYGTTWTSTVFGERFDIYLPSKLRLVYRTKDGLFTNDSWQFRDGNIAIGILRNPAYPLELSLTGRVEGDRIVGTAMNLVPRPGATAQQVTSEWSAQKLAQPIPELVAAAPVKPTPAAPRANSNEFAGRYAIMLSEAEGSTLRNANFRVSCGIDGCTVSVGNGDAETYDAIRSLRSAEFAQAKFALNYAKERKAEATKEAPWLAPLLSSKSDLASCLDLRKSNGRDSDIVGMQILCRLDSNPWGKPVLLFMGTILANCGPAFCRYGMLPVFREP